MKKIAKNKNGFAWVLDAIPESSIYLYLVSRIEDKIAQHEFALEGYKDDLKLAKKEHNKQMALDNIKEQKQRIKTKNKILASLKQVIKQLEKAE
jgi:ppGpp synthetase/RelA/SpoT-type nucleotidyltranferase